MQFLQLPNQVCKTLTFSSNPPHDTVIFTCRARHFFLPGSCRANAASLICTRLKPSKINSNNASKTKTKTSKIRLNHIISLGFLCSLGDNSVTPETSAEGTANDCNYTTKIYHVLMGKELWHVPSVLGDSCWPTKSHSCLSADAKSWAHAVMLTFSPSLCKCISLEHSIAGSFWLSVSEVSTLISKNCGSSGASFVFQM